MGDIVAFRRPANRPPDPETRDDLTLEVQALRAEALDLVNEARPIVARLAVLGINTSPAVLRQARELAALLDRTQRRYGHQDGAA